MVSLVLSRHYIYFLPPPGNRWCTYAFFIAATWRPEVPIPHQCASGIWIRRLPGTVGTVRVCSVPVRAAPTALRCHALGHRVRSTPRMKNPSIFGFWILDFWFFWILFHWASEISLDFPIFC